MLSLNQVIQIAFNLSTKNASPSYLARVGNCSTTECLILQFLSWESSVKAGIIDYERFSMPMTWFRSSSLLKRFNLTSELSSLRSAKKRGNMCSFVAALSIIGQIANRFSAKALLTYWKVSVYSFFKQGIIFSTIVLPSRTLQKSDSLLTPAVLTSDSESCKKLV